MSPDSSSPERKAVPALVLSAWVIMGLIGLAAAGLGLPLWPLYTRFHGKELLRSQRRSKIVAIAHEKPGVDLSELGSLTGISRASVRYHLRYLEREGLIRVSILDHRKRVYPPGAPR
jgi:predicted transcriptional regulator